MADELVSTDEAILNNIGEGDEQTSSDGAYEEGTGASEDAGTEASESGSQQGTEEGGSGQQARPAGGPQDLVDAAGNVIATGGKERRFYETAQREKARADNSQREVESLQAQIEAVNNAGTLGTQYELSPEEVTTGAQIMAAYKKSPIETIQYMLTQAQAAGHNIDSIASGGMDMKAVQQMLDSALKPLVEEHTDRADTQEANDRAVEIYNGFMTQHPDAAPHENALARLLQEDPNLSPEAAYYKLQSFYAQRNLDWTKSLEQLQATAKQQPSVNTQQPIPNGGITPGNVTDTAQVADVNTSTDDIIRQAMAEAGIQS
jgi:hypothetical protein